ncbi:hypothetical protein [Cupriavidus taiwanensis]|uniref:hypothetical protein n=1 Tax=Cupriavidus taiwanensis TaxID=164546 RepID=UPI000E1A52A7|nr:hypothetical protein [Cupriavidus taiwanensis]SPC11872.1 conserved hypothetical protein [Cupriavidus taiwanensis]
MLSILQAQWESASRTALDLTLCHLQAATALAQAPFSAADPGAARAPARQALAVLNRYAEERAAQQAQWWRAQRDRLDLAGVAQAWRGLDAIEADLAARAAQARAGYNDAVREALARYLEDLAEARDGNDIGLALLRALTDWQEAGKTCAGQAAAMGAAMMPAWTQWLHSALAEPGASRAVAGAAGQRAAQDG